MFHFYNHSPDSPTVQTRRLAPALALTQRDIPCLVWAEDALSFAHFAPTCLFALQLLVPDQHLNAAALAITSTQRYERIAPCSKWREWKSIDPSQPHSFPMTIFLKSTTPHFLRHQDTPEKIYLHPASSFHFPDLQDSSQTLTLSSTLPPDYTSIRFPTRPAFLDALIDTMLDPPSGQRILNLTTTLDVYISYIIMYTLRAAQPVLPDESLGLEYAALRDSLKEENRPVFEYRVRGKSLAEGWGGEMRERRKIMATTPRFAQAWKPLPLDALRLRNITESRRLKEKEGAQSSGKITRMQNNPMSPTPRIVAHSALSLARRFMR